MILYYFFRIVLWLISVITILCNYNPNHIETLGVPVLVFILTVICDQILIVCTGIKNYKNSNNIIYPCIQIIASIFGLLMSALILIFSISSMINLFYIYKDINGYQIIKSNNYFFKNLNIDIIHIKYVLISICALSGFEYAFPIKREK